MTELVCKNGYRPLPQQQAFRSSNATVRGFGGALGGGKSFALCQEVFDWMLEHPGIQIPVFRNIHTSITLSTRRTFIEQVLPPELRARKDLVRIKQSAGEDFVEFLWNGAAVHFVGLDNPGKWFSTEIGAACFDECHQIDEKDVRTIWTRVRQRCNECVRTARADDDDCTHMPHRMILTFNPSYPGHWLQEWFILGGHRTQWGYRKDELYATDADDPMGDSEFFFSLPTHNPYLTKKYLSRNLAGLSRLEKRMYMYGEWLNLSGNTFFDDEAIASSTTSAAEFQPLHRNAEPYGDLTGEDKDNPPQIRPTGKGRMEVYRAPVRWHTDKNGDEIKGHRYVVSVDASSGVSSDWSAVQVIDVDELEQVAEWQGKVDPDQLAEVAFLTACVYNGALLAPEITGGWGHAVVNRCREMIANWRGKPEWKPSLYLRPNDTKLSRKFTDLIGWDTNTKTRAQMLDVLEESLRDGSLTVHGTKTLHELAAFAIPERVGNVGDYRSPRAQKGAHDDLVIALAIGVYVASRQPKQLQRRPRPPEPVMMDATGW